MDPALLEKALTRKTRAIEPVHLNGRLCDMEVIMDFAQRKGLFVIEDAAQALGASLRLKDGTIKKAGSFGLTGCFSLYWAKVLGGWGNNGMVVTDDPQIAEKIRFLRYNGEDRETRNFYYHSHNLLMDNLHAALLNVKFKYLTRWLERRQEISRLYYEGLKTVAEVQTPHFEDPRYKDIFTNYVIRARNRDELKKYLAEHGIESLISWPTPMYKQPVFTKKKYAKEFGKPRLISHKGAGRLPETERICREVLSLPRYPELTNKQVKYVVKKIREFYKR